MTASQHLPTVLLILGLAFPAAAGAAGGTGAAELSLDRMAVVSLVRAALPDSLQILLPATGELTLKVAPPLSVEFTDGGIEADFMVTIVELDYTGRVHVRYVPELEPLEGEVGLRAETAVPDLVLPVAFDLASWLPPVKLPRSFRWSLDGPAGKKIEVRCLVQGIQIDEDRLVILLGVLSR
ncbi:MAG: hypothetical protein ACE5ID_05375 [Acidobacteriota bacterium]